MRNKKKYAKQLTYPRIQYHCILLGIRILNLSCFESLNDVFKVSNQSIALEIGREYLDRPIFRLKLWKKIPELQKYQQLCGRRSADFGEMCIYFLEQSSLKCNKNAIFLFKNFYNKEKDQVLFESDVFCYVW